MECKLNKPYPEVEVEGKNLYYANLLLEDYAGISGELTAITQYVYQKFEKFKEDDEFATTMGQIAVVEMKHLELLGKTIKLLGLDPIFKFKNKNYYEMWNSSFVNYDNNLVEMIKNDIEKEKKAIKNYKLHIQMIDDKYIKRMLMRIIEDEELHVQCFKYLLNKTN